MSRWLALAALALLLVAVPAEAKPGSRNPGYEGSTGIFLNAAVPNWILVDNVASVREVDVHVLGAVSDSHWPRQFGCWYSPDPSNPYKNATPIYMLDFIPEQTRNSDIVDGERDFTFQFGYSSGLDAPDGTDTVLCGWDPLPVGYSPITFGFGRAHIFYTSEAP